MTDPTPSRPADDANPEVEIDDPFEVPPEVERAWDEEHVAEGEAPSG